MQPDPARLGRGLTVALALIIAGLTLAPREVISADDLPHLDKLWHALAFAALVLPTAALDPKRLRWVVPAALGLGLAIELIQPQVGRPASALDFAADALGVAVGVLLGVALRPLTGRAGRSDTANPR